MKIEQRSVETLIPYINNSRKHSDEQIAQIAASIKEFGWTNPILVDGANGLIAGHGRLMAARKLKMDKVPVIELAHLSENQKKALIIADNKLALNSDWDSELLTLELQELLGEEYDLELLGFDKDELDALLNVIEGTDGLTDEDAVPEVPDEPKTKPGDVYILGNHRLMCGDSTSIDAVEKLMNGQKADMVFTDPPYRYKPMGSGGVFDDGYTKLKKDLTGLIDFNPAEFLNILPTVFNKGINAYIFCNTDLVPDYCNWAKESKFNFNILTWHKKSFIPATNNHHYPDTEYLIYISKNAKFNTGLDVHYGKYFVLNNEKSEDHPTIKPVEILTTEIQISSNANDVVLDLFGGSGSTMIAAEKIGRKAYLMELDPKYCDVIVKRWEDFTGKQAILETQGVESIS
jgi:DNA modification methylase